MKTCGVEIKSNEIIFVLLDSHGALIPITDRKIQLEDSDSAESVIAFYAKLKDWLFKHHVDRVIIKKRAKKGKFAGGADSFKIEGLVQMMDFCDVKLVSPQAIASLIKNNPQEIPEDILKYQEAAFWAAMYAIKNS